MSVRFATSPDSRFGTYLDANAGAPLRNEVREELLRALSSSLVPNPSSIHSYGREAKRILNGAREKIARSFGASSFPEQITLTSSGSEASQLAIRSALESSFLRGEKPHWITTRVEHDATLQMVEWARARGGSVSFLPVDLQGRPDASKLSELIRPETRLISVIWVNNETGVITDVEAIAAEAAKAGVPLHLDGAQAWGKIPLNLSKTGAHWVSFSGHKIGALSGTGVLWKARSAPFLPSILGTQESGVRGGTENLLGILSLGAAAERLSPEVWSEAVGPTRDALEKEILSRIVDARINGAGVPRVANTLSVSFEGIEKTGLVAALDLAGFSVSAGSACSSGLEASHVLMAMGHSKELAQASVRISLFEPLSNETQCAFINALADCVQRMRKSPTPKTL